MDEFDITITGEREIADDALRAARALADFTPELRVAAEMLSARIARRFQDASSLLLALSARTVKARRAKVAKGASLVGGIDTPLRAFADSLYKAATATLPGVTGSAAKASPGEVAVGIDPAATPYMRAVLLGDPGRNIPERDALDLPGSDTDAVLAAFDATVEKKLLAALGVL